MEKQLLENFIKKYHLNSTIESVTWESSGKELSTTFAADDKGVIGTIQIPLLTFPTGAYSIFQTSKLKSLLNILADEIEVEVIATGKIATALSFTDTTSSTKVVFVLSDASNIPKAPELISLPDFQLNIDISYTFMEQFVTAQRALADNTSVSIVTDGKINPKLILGYSKNNTDRVTLESTCSRNDKIGLIHFRADYLQQIFSANKGVNGILQVAEDGLARIVFSPTTYIANYYLPAIDLHT